MSIILNKSLKSKLQERGGGGGRGGGKRRGGGVEGEGDELRIEK